MKSTDHLNALNDQVFPAMSPDLNPTEMFGMGEDYTLQLHTILLNELLSISKRLSNKYNAIENKV